jgi:hypothetical protein
VKDAAADEFVEYLGDNPRVPAGGERPH